MVMTNKKTSRADRQLNRTMYAPKPVVRSNRNVQEPAEVVALKKLTAKVLDSLKNPSAIPSQVILDALIKARAM